MPISPTCRRLLAGILIGFAAPAGVVSAQGPPPGEVPAVKSIFFRAAVFFVPAPLADPAATAAEVLRRGGAGGYIRKADSRPVRSGRHVAWKVVSTDAFPVPGDEVLAQKGRGVGEKAIALLRQSREVLTVEFLVVDPENHAYLEEANRFLHDVARRTGGFIWDTETRQMFSVTAWQQQRLEAPERDLGIANTTIQGHPEGERVRAITLGMRKLGHPDYAVEDFSRGNWVPMGDLLYFFIAESTARGPLRVRTDYPAAELREKLNFPPGTLVPPLSLVPAARRPGDPENLVLTLDWSIYPGDSLPARQGYLVENLLVPDPELRVVRAHQQELLVLSAVARGRLAEKRTGFHKGLPPGEEIQVKAWHRGEYVWLRLVGWEQDRLTGLLTADHPRLRDLKAGARLEIGLDDVFDYVHRFPDGRVEGDETGAAIDALLAREKGETAGAGEK